MGARLPHLLRILGLTALTALLGAGVEAAVILIGGFEEISKPLEVGAFAIILGSPAHMLLQGTLIVLVRCLRTDDRLATSLRMTLAAIRGDSAAAAEALIVGTRYFFLCGLFAIGLALAGPFVLDSIVTPSYRMVAIAGIGLITLLAAFVLARALGPLVAWCVGAIARSPGLPLCLVRLYALTIACSAAIVTWLAVSVAPRETLEVLGTTLGAFAGLGVIVHCLRRFLFPPAWLAPVLLLAIASAGALLPRVHAARADATLRMPSARLMQRLIWSGAGSVVAGNQDRVLAHSWVDLPRGWRAPKHVVFLSIDALRADRLGCYGYRSRPTSPVIDDLATRAAFFADAHAQGTTSLRSFPAVFLSKYPHTVPWVLYRSGRVMPDPAKTLAIAEILRGAGFRTVAVLHSRYVRNDGLMQGFDEVLSDPPGVDTRTTTKTLRAERFVDQAIEYLEGHPVGDRRLFLWMHFIDPHEPYNRVPGLDWGETPSERYDAEIRFVDTQLGRFLTYLEQKGISDDALLVLFSDHGEEFGEHGQRFHGHSLNRIATHVPLLFWGRGVRAGRRPGTVGLIDVMPTVLNLLSLRRGSLQGASLARSLLASVDPPARTIVSELFPTRLSSPNGWSAERNGWKLLLDGSFEPLALYRTSRDPAERRNQIQSEAAIRDAMRRDVAAVTELR